MADKPLATVDEAVLAAALSGDEAAFGCLYEALQPGLLRYAALLSGQDAEDVCAETWLQACRDIGGFSGDLVQFRGWIARIARNRAIDLGRARQRRPADLLPPGELGDFDDSRAGSAELGAMDSLATRRALELIGGLPKDQAEAIMLRVVLGLDAKSAAAVVGKRPGAVRTAAYRGLRTLQLRLGEAEG